MVQAITAGGGGGGPVEFVQANSDTSTGPITLTGVTAGNTLCAVVLAIEPVSSTSLPAGWQKQTAGGADAHYGVWWVYPNHGGGSVSATISTAPSDCGWSIHEYSGVNTSSPIYDSTGTINTGVGNPWTSSTMDVVEGGAMALGVVHLSTGGTITFTGGGFTVRTDQPGHSHATADVDDIAATGTLAGSGVPVSGSTANWGAFAISLNPA